MCKNGDVQVTDVPVDWVLLPSFPVTISKPNQDDSPIAKKKEKFHSQQKLQKKKKKDYFSIKHITLFELSIQILLLKWDF